MREISNPPHAASLLESMRSIGYSLDSALADLIDNSLTAKSGYINIEFRPFEIPYIAIIDDGIGMSKEELFIAMRHGSTNPLLIRHQDDLGRYGLGLKTSSLSQCRCLTVISLKNNELSAYRWDLDIVVAKEAWIILELENEEISSLPHFDILKKNMHGTIVLWQNFDRLIAGESSIALAMGEKMDQARQHLSLVFHRYISPEPGRKKVVIAINQNPLPAIDPFLSTHKATQYLDEDNFHVSGSKVVVKPYILPHISKLTPIEMNRAGGSLGLRSQQGFYIYRNKRLIIWGTWFRLARKDELSKLARIRVDIPNTLDHLWTLDVKKSAAFPPEIVRTNLRRTIEKIRQASGRTIAFRGRFVDKGEITPGWNEVLDRNGVRFDINRTYPALKDFVGRLNKKDAHDFECILLIIESTFPAEALYSRMASDFRPIFNTSDVEYKLREMAKTLILGGGRTEVIDTLLDNLYLIEPFNQHKEITMKIIRDIKNDN